MKLFPVAHSFLGIVFSLSCGALLSGSARSQLAADQPEPPTEAGAGKKKLEEEGKKKEEQKLPAGKKPEKEMSISELIQSLGAEGFRERRAAHRELGRRGDQPSYAPVLEACVAGYFGSDDPEIRVRLKSLMEAMVTKNLFPRPKGFLGIMMNVSSDMLNGKTLVRGVEVSMVVPDSAAKAADLRLGDLIYQVDELAFTEKSTTQTFMNYIGSKKVGEKIKMKISRSRRPVTVVATLKSRPAQYNVIQKSAEEFFENWFSTQLAVHRKP